jgi:protein-S-isoprenylcysteine O-methyltransferase Ste14
VDDGAARGHHLGSLLVGLQFALIAVLVALAAPAAARAPAAAWALASAGGLLALWALGSNRPGNFNIHPSPRAGGRLVQGGPYRWIRHPMYSAILLCGLACAWVAASPWAWAAEAVTVAVLTVKAGLEERWMLGAHPGYAAYRARTRRFVPWVY